MKFAKFNQYTILNPVLGQGFPPNLEVMLTEYELKEFRSLVPAFDSQVTLSEIPKEKIYKGQDLTGKTVGFYYPAGIGDAACHSALIRSLKSQFCLLKIRVYATQYTAAIWYMNPDIEHQSAMPCPPTRQDFNQCDYWIIGDAVIYNLKGQGQGSIYEELSNNLNIGVGIKSKARPHLTVSEEESKALMQCFAGFKIGKPVLIFAPMATKENRTWNPKHWKDFISKASKRFFVLATGIKNIDFKSEGCLNLRDLKLRELVVLARHASAIVTVDSALLHIGAAFDIRTVALMGPFSPGMRCSTYKNCTSIYHKEACSIAPCCHHDKGFPKDCPGKTSCSVLDSVTSEEILKLLP